jgi:hypothetical protein
LLFSLVTTDFSKTFPSAFMLLSWPHHIWRTKDRS